MKALLIATCITVFFIPPVSAQRETVICKDLSVRQLTDCCYLHVSLLPLQGGTMFPCNGIVYVNQGQAIVLDTPVNDTLSERLIEWIEHDLHAKVVAVVANHFHEDCLGGIGPFLSRGCPVYAHSQTCRLFNASGWPCSAQSFEDSLVLHVGGEKIINRYFGPAHSPDNIVTYIPSEHLLFGGCMVKELNAGYGNLSDASLREWPHTVQKVKASYTHARIVVPGHGREGNTALLDYTIELFRHHPEQTQD